MRITGLKHQWGDRLLDQFVHDDAVDDRIRKRDEFTLKLLQYLGTIDGPDLWVGTSHSQLNFCARDTTHESDRIPSLAFLDSYGTHVKIAYVTPREFQAWPETQVTGYARSIEDAARLLLVAIASSDSNPARPSAQWNWFVCPACDFHSSQYAIHCQRCHYKFPPEPKAVAIGLYRKPRLPEGAVVPRKGDASEGN